MPHHYPAQRPYKITDGKKPERLKLPEPVWKFSREKELSDLVRKKDENDEVVEFPMRRPESLAQAYGSLISSRFSKIGRPRSQ
jgi:hypothetical protein